MGSVIEQNIECPECKQNTCFSDYYYKNHEDIFVCENEDCGFSYTYFWKRDGDGEFVLNNKEGNVTFDNLIMVETIVKDGVKTVNEIKNYISYE
jgi:hypothetical protein